ncbi:protein phosphatase methylesterase, putative [Pediculus humanus corporis]|uniref:Protein phosphatase methylesterase 1 n=1 Tax=Pediculus humanus subsp. corporis TaxID=121224 RepID=E0VWV3_PEDHC|nr:protein phosphatase methylesterase, putative [Pediculus humanus corporis]EEB17859.1 protein phosphatase methylesterase, putative [Pediculus humanus corporis]
MSTIQKTMFKSRLPPLAPTARFGKRMAMRKHDYKPVQWNKYFEKFIDVAVDSGQFRVYLLGSEGPVLFLLHGGGLSALGWSLFADSVTKIVKCRVVALDLRGHGSTKTDDEFNLSAETLSKDIGGIIQELYQDESPPIILVGHSMGGAIAIHTAYNNYISSLIGLVVIDVVEGTAMDALSSMQSFLRGRPKSFSSLENAIEWCVRSGQVRNVESAKVSMPGQIVNCETGELAIEDISNDVCNSQTSGTMHSVQSVSNPDRILEENENEEVLVNDKFKTPLQDTPKAKYKWRIDLSKTECHWPGWFKGLSSLFLNCSVPKLLILAGIDTLDRELTVGQMQGKFQMQVLPQCGHAVHEDVPEKVAEILASFMVRFKFAESTSDFHRPFPGC